MGLCREAATSAAVAAATASSASAAVLAAAAARHETCAELVYAWGGRLSQDEADSLLLAACARGDLGACRALVEQVSADTPFFRMGLNPP